MGKNDFTHNLHTKTNQTTTTKAKVNTVFRWLEGEINRWHAEASWGSQGVVCEDVTPEAQC